MYPLLWTEKVTHLGRLLSMLDFKFDWTTKSRGYAIDDVDLSACPLF